jgi:hypothetical protein
VLSFKAVSGENYHDEGVFSVAVFIYGMHQERDGKNLEGEYFV